MMAEGLQQVKNQTEEESRSEGGGDEKGESRRQIGFHWVLSASLSGKVQHFQKGAPSPPGKLIYEDLLPFPQ